METVMILICEQDPATGKLHQDDPEFRDPVVADQKPDDVVAQDQDDGERIEFVRRILGKKQADQNENENDQRREIPAVSRKIYEGSGSADQYIDPERDRNVRQRVCSVYCAVL